MPPKMPFLFFRRGIFISKICAYFTEIPLMHLDTKDICMSLLLFACTVNPGSDNQNGQRNIRYISPLTLILLF